MKVDLVARTEPVMEYFINAPDIVIPEGGKLTAEQLIVYIARVSSPRVDKDEAPEKLLNYLLRKKHVSPFDQVDLSFRIETSRAISAQAIRHWTIKPQEFSQRYATVQVFEDIEFRMAGDSNRQGSTYPVMRYEDANESVFITEEARQNLTVSNLVDLNKLSKAVEDHMVQTKRLYDRLTTFGVAPECSRMILPMASRTIIFMKGSARSWIHLLEARLPTDAQKEFRLIALEIAKVFEQEFPIISKSLGLRERIEQT